MGGCSLPVYFDSAKKRVHDFCSRSHADKAIADGQWTRSTSSGNTNAGGSTCKLPGCHLGVFIDPVTSLVIADLYRQVQNHYNSVRMQPTL